MNIRIDTLPHKKIFLLLVISLLGTFGALICNVSASPVIGFDAGNIIDDIVFTDYRSMDVSQIQTFLNSKIPTCDTYGTQPSEYGGGTRAQWAANASLHPIMGAFYPPFTCLKDYSENGISAAQIIYNTAQQYQINPQVLIVLLQKEQALITDTWPSPGQYKTATGYGCPDTAPCDSQYFGLTNQLSQSGKMFRAILNNSPTWYTPYGLGNYTVYFNPGPYNYNAGKYYGNAYDKYGNSIPDISYCGSTTVNIQNRATQALYNYTPYQPNQAALNAGYGTGDICSASGNRNFYLYFTDWFGPTFLVTEGLLLRSANTGKISRVEGGTLHYIPNLVISNSRGYNLSTTKTIGDTELNNIPSGADVTYDVNSRNGQLVRSDSTGRINIVLGGVLHYITNLAALYLNGYSLANVKTISDMELSYIPNGTDINYDVNSRNGQLVRSNTTGRINIVLGGIQHYIPNLIISNSRGYDLSTIKTISDAELSVITSGADMTYYVNYRDSQLVRSDSTGRISIVESGTLRYIPNLIIFNSKGYNMANVKTISDVELSYIPSGADMTYYVNYRDSQLVRSDSTGRISIVESGTLRYIPNLIIFNSKGYNMANVKTISDVELSYIPSGADMN